MLEYLEESERAGALGSVAQMAAIASADKGGLGALLAQNGWLWPRCLLPPPGPANALLLLPPLDF